MQSRSSKNHVVIDLSHHNGTIDFAKVKKDPKNIVGVILKASQGTTYKDSKFEENYTKATKEGFWVGAYHFANFGGNVEAAKKEAAFFLSTVKGKTLKYLVLDIETGSGDLSESSLAFLEAVKAVHNSVMLYTGAAFVNSHLKNAKLSVYPLWVAHYGVDKPRDNVVWKEWKMFQYSDAGKVQGISGNVDMNEYIPDPVPVVKPYPYDKTKGLGMGEVIQRVELRDKPSFDKETITRILEVGQVYYVYGETNGLYNLGNSYANKTCIKFTPHPK